MVASNNNTSSYASAITPSSLTFADASNKDSGGFGSFWSSGLSLFS